MRVVVLEGTLESPALIRATTHPGRKQADQPQRLVELMHDLDSLVRDNKPDAVVVRGPDKAPAKPAVATTRTKGQFDGVALAVARETIAVTAELPGVMLGTTCGTSKEEILKKGAQVAGDSSFADAGASALAALVLAAKG